MASSQRRAVRWVEGPEDPEFEARLAKELEQRRLARIEERARRRHERRSRRLFILFTIVVLALVGAIGYAVVTILQTQFV
jgi:cell division septal protein FtsQ